MADLLSTTSGFGNIQSFPPGMSPMEFFLQQTPGWSFTNTEANRAAMTGAGSRGTLLKRPGTLAALRAYNTGVADQTYDNQVQRYLSLADLGLRGATAPFV